GVDGPETAVVPRLRIADAEQHLGVRVPLHELDVEGAEGKIQARLVVAKDALPVDRPPPGRVRPDVDVAGVLDDLGHVVARAETGLLQRGLQGFGPGSSEPSADDLQWSAPLPLRAGRRARDRLLKREHGGAAGWPRQRRARWMRARRRRAPGRRRAVP